MLTRIEANKELRKRGYKKDDEPGFGYLPTEVNWRGMLQCVEKT